MSVGHVRYMRGGGRVSFFFFETKNKIQKKTTLNILARKHDNTLCCDSSNQMSMIIIK